MNKAASMHYGLGTKWCITMKDQSYFEDYDKSNVVFFFVLNKELPKDDPLHKIALAYQRDIDNKVIQVDIFDARDELLADSDWETEPEFNRVISITDSIAKTYPKSLLAKIYSNELSIEEVFELFKKENNPQLKEAIAQWYLHENLPRMTTSSGRGKAYSFDDTMQLLDKSGDMETVKELAASSKGSLFTKLTASHDIKERYEHLMPAVIAGTNFREVGHQALWQRMQTFHTLNSKDIAAIYFKYELPVEEIVNLLRCDNTPTNVLIDAYKNYHATESICRALAENDNTPTDIIDKLAWNNDTPTQYSAIDNLNISTETLDRIVDHYSKDRTYSHNILSAALGNDNLSESTIRKLFSAMSGVHLPYVSEDLLELAKRPNTPSDILHLLAIHCHKRVSPSPDARAEELRCITNLLLNKNTSTEDVKMLVPFLKYAGGTELAMMLSTIDPPPHREIMEWIIANVQNTAMVMRARRRLAEFDEMHKAEASFQPSILKQAYEFAGNQNYHDEFYPYSNYFYPGQTIETQDGGYYRGLWPRFQDRQRDGKEFKEFSEFKKKRKNRLKRLKMLRKIRNLQSKPLTPALPATPLTGLYGEIGIEGLYTSPLEYYSGSIADGPNANTNPNYTTYQVMSPTASDMREARMKLGASKDWWRLSQ